MTLWTTKQPNKFAPVHPWC